MIDGSLDIRDADDTNIEGGKYPSLMALISAQKINLDSAITLGLLEAGIPPLGTDSKRISQKANYSNALQTVTYTNTNDTNPVIGARSIKWVVNDGDINSTEIESHHCGRQK